MIGVTASWAASHGQAVTEAPNVGCSDPRSRREPTIMLRLTNRLGAAFSTILLITSAGCAGPALTERPSPPLAPGDRVRLQELDAYWAEVSRAVNAGDFEGYKATCHDGGVLVSGINRRSQPLSDALAGWKDGFDTTKAGENQASVEFRFSQRLGDSTTAHETGIFLYSTVAADGKRSHQHIHFEGLLVKQGGKWLILMEYQDSVASQKQWQALE